MPRYMVERTFPRRLEVPDFDRLVRRNGELGVTWLHSYVTEDGRTSFCVYEAPSADAIRATAQANDLPVHHVTEVRVLDPYFYR